MFVERILLVRRALLWGLCILCATSGVARACWLAPPDIVWGRSANGELEFLRENRMGRITVFERGSRQKALWSVIVPEFDSLFSATLLTDDGERIIHVRGNHSVNKFTDAAVHVFRRDGTSCTLKVREFTRSLAHCNPFRRKSTDPKTRWLKTVKEVTNKSFTVVSAKGRTTTVLFSDLAARMHAP